MKHFKLFTDRNNSMGYLWISGFHVSNTGSLRRRPEANNKVQMDYLGSDSWTLVGTNGNETGRGGANKGCKQDTAVSKWIWVLLKNSEKRFKTQAQDLSKGGVGSGFSPNSRLSLVECSSQRVLISSPSSLHLSSSVQEQRKLVWTYKALR